MGHTTEWTTRDIDQLQRTENTVLEEKAVTKVICEDCGTEQSVSIFSPNCSECDSQELTMIEGKNESSA